MIACCDRGRNSEKLWFERALAVGGTAMGATATGSTKKGAGNVRLNVRLMAPILGWVILGVAVGISTVTWPVGAQTLAIATQDLVLRPGWNVVFLKVAAPQDQLEQLLRVGKVSEIVVRTTGPGTIMNSLASSRRRRLEGRHVPLEIARGWVSARVQRSPMRILPM